MAQAKTLTAAELKQVLGHIAASNRHAARNRAMLLVIHWAARNRAMLLVIHWARLRVGEVAALIVADMLYSDGTVKEEVRLAAQQTKAATHTPYTWVLKCAKSYQAT